MAIPVLVVMTPPVSNTTTTGPALVIVLPGTVVVVAVKIGPTAFLSVVYTFTLPAFGPTGVTLTSPLHGQYAVVLVTVAVTVVAGSNQSVHDAAAEPAVARRPSAWIVAFIPTWLMQL